MGGLKRSIRRGTLEAGQTAWRIDDDNGNDKTSTLMSVIMHVKVTWDSTIKTPHHIYALQVLAGK